LDSTSKYRPNLASVSGKIARVTSIFCLFILSKY
jgi:hypothetical protein